MKDFNVDLCWFSRLGQQIVYLLNDELKENDRKFIKRAYDMSPKIYMDRLRAIGFDKHKRVLDAGCGFGQWTICLSELGVNVTSIDISMLRLRGTQMALAELGYIAQTAQANLEAIPLKSNCFDGIFCYGSLFCTPWKESLCEFARILKPGGYIYFSANEIGYILHMWQKRPNRTGEFDPRESAVNTFRNTLDYELYGLPPRNGQILITCDEAKKELQKMGFDLLFLKPEGTLNLVPNKLKPKPFFESEYNGLPGCYEVLAQKK